MMNLVEKAEARSRDRAIVYYLTALVLLLVAIARLRVSDGSWFVIVGAAALSLTSLPIRLFEWRKLAPLLNDETTRDHRRSSIAAGFWVMLASAALIAGLPRFHALEAIVAARIVITAGLMAALIAFATLELRAGR
ncbi:hypothetical protein [Sphingomonas sanguinis]|uniref:Uncharacterized protein n=1 Tax=Sphingomonas sanguinis TaxID=33051 RepID=A0A147IQQ1_9SPHN|nr:hypothetical protein [Sphingomonas sanguinis]KTT97555.1 hypothetical protein SB4_13140 [Sphingomonas sanguinis]